MIAATLTRILFFGGHYTTTLALTRLLSSDAEGLLLTIATVEFFRILFDYGLENTILSRVDRRTGVTLTGYASSFSRFRLIATAIGQIVTSTTVWLICSRNELSIIVPLVGSLQFTFLMVFGYLQAHLQVNSESGIRKLAAPLALAFLIQTLLIGVASIGRISISICAISFHLMAVAACIAISRKSCRENNKPIARVDCMALPEERLKTVLAKIAPLGNVALIGIAYARVDGFIVSMIASGTLVTQYLLYQRLASAPLMLFSTVANVSIAPLAALRNEPVPYQYALRRYRRLAYVTGIITALLFAAASTKVAASFGLEYLMPQLAFLQSYVLGVQIINGFHSAGTVAAGRADSLWKLARNNAILAFLILACGSWKYGVWGLVATVCVVETFCLLQHIRNYSQFSVQSSEAEHANT